MESFFFGTSEKKDSPKSEAEKKAVTEQKKKDREEKERGFSFWFKIGNRYAKHVNKPLVEGYGKLEYAKPLLMVQDHQAEIARNREAGKMSSPEDGGPTEDQIYTAAIALAKKLGWKEKPPIRNEATEDIPSDSAEEKQEHLDDEITEKIQQELLSLGVTQEEIDAMDATEAWDLLQEKTLAKEIKGEPLEKLYTTNELDKDFSILHDLWQEACEKMENVTSFERASEILDLTAESFDDPQPLEKYLEENTVALKPEEKFFIEISIEMKKFRTKAKDLIYEGVESKDEDHSAITKEQFATFVDTGKVPETVLHGIAEKLINAIQLTREEIAVYGEHASVVEELLREPAALKERQDKLQSFIRSLEKEIDDAPISDEEKDVVRQKVRLLDEAIEKTLTPNGAEYLSSLSVEQIKNITLYHFRDLFFDKPLTDFNALDEKGLKNIVQYLEVRGYDNPDLERRELENPTPTLNELFMGCYVEQIENHTRDAVITLRDKGFNTIESGFDGDAQLGNQLFHMMGEIPFDESLIKNLEQKFSIDIVIDHPDLSDGKHTIVHFRNKDGEYKTLEEWKETLDTFAEEVPVIGDRPLFAPKGETIDFVYKNIQKYPKELFLEQTKNDKEKELIEQLYNCKTEEDVEKLLSL